MRLAVICSLVMFFCSCKSEFERIDEEGMEANREILDEIRDLSSKLENFNDSSISSLSDTTSGTNDVFISNSNNYSSENISSDSTIIKEDQSQYESILTKKERASLKVYESLADPELVKLYNRFDIENMNYPGITIEAMIVSVGYTQGVIGKLKDNNPNIDYLIMPSYYNNLNAFALNCVAVNKHYEYIENVVFYENYSYYDEIYKTSVSKKNNDTYILTTEVEQKTEVFELKFLENGYFKQSKTSK